MTAPGEPRIQINPASTEGLDEWLTADTAPLGDETNLTVEYHRRNFGALLLSMSRRDWCSLSDWLAGELWQEANELAGEVSAAEAARPRECAMCGKSDPEPERVRWLPPEIWGERHGVDVDRTLDLCQPCMQMIGRLAETDEDRKLKAWGRAARVRAGAQGG
jgi:hypothetical protein